MFRVIGRVFLSTIFILFGISSIINWDVAYTDLDTAIVNWQMYKGTAEVLGSVLDQTTEYVAIILGIGIFLQIVGGLLIFFGFRVKLGAVMLAFYLLISTFLFFPFWFYEGEQMNFNLILFLKNISILGGIFLLLGTRGLSLQTIDMLDNER